MHGMVGYPCWLGWPHLLQLQSRWCAWPSQIQQSSP
jgi:hypothetical protein